MKLGFYGKLLRLIPFEWNDFLEFRIGLSGTDAIFIRLIYRLVNENIDVTLFTDYDFPSLGTSQVIQANSFGQSVQLCSELGIDIILAVHDEGDDLKQGIEIAESLGVKIVVLGQNSPTKLTSNFYSNSNAVKRFICVSNNQANHLRHHDLFKKCEVILNGIDIRPFSSLNSKMGNIVTFIGAITENKGIHILLKIWPEVLKKIPHARLRIIGSAKLYSRENELGPLGIGSKDFEEKYVIPIFGEQNDALGRFNIEPLGLLSPTEIINYLFETSIGVVNPNYNYEMAVETFCISAVEVQACSTLVLGGKVGGLLDTVRNGKSGFLCSSPDELCARIIWSLENPNKANEMGKEGRRFVEEKFNFDNIFPRWVNMFQSVLNNQKPSRISYNILNVEFRVIIKDLIRLVKFVYRF